MGDQMFKLTEDEIHEIEDLIERFSKESESVISAERIIRELEINGKSCRVKVIVEVEEDYFEDSFND
ncbi:hypothetical protein BGV40_14245 [Methanosarcina sp. Ant1]|nr:hypothetical protein BGV40_14245 [Methanosarcina sp. Ant1]